MLPTPQLVVMAKAPRLGTVKTRLARGVGAVEATRFYRRTGLDLLRRLGPDPRCQTLLALAPDRAVHEKGVWPESIMRVAQGPGDLGARMGRLMRDLPPGPVVIVGSDIPGIARAHIAQAFRALGRFDAVFGPAHDGGYWLVGLKRRPRVAEIFGGVRWSSEHALADTIANVRRAGLSVAMLETLADVDTEEDYARWRGRPYTNK
ncbi:MAG TPA: TIGR04282 family arsenosugar biosynthesis glycosyltransferase [Parvibaculum sp.]